MATVATQPRLIIWDVDRTLIETPGIGIRLARAAFYELAGRNPDRLDTPSGKTEPVILAETLRANGIEPTEELQRRYARVLPEQYRRHRDQLRAGGRGPGRAA